ncbi:MULTISPECIES: F0F1 ATP synthase subunit delta [Roseateles]|uniref:ATP synthase subunit delta n=1 Tax=Pelomonas caseinilytica TaxID=2906763 RepID=A0ABS8XEC3_9BURK|nr:MULTISPECIES: F0F1 ATP synthase subunit delta [unclassified Roseateles]MCE4537181.1 F0F1 ATP synthase subunit delta [Pelomonas sp. P7]HEV6966976.1 F0F1 ATP synthase subunit delta [Roseateles sp.]
MAEIATIARPYAEALFQVARSQDAAAWGRQLDALAQVAQDADLRQFADHPKADPQQVVAVMTAAARQDLAAGVQNFLRTVVENGRLAALPEIVAQYHALANAASGVSDAQIYSAFEISDAQLADLKASLEKRFGRKLDARVHLEPGLIGGVRVVVGDEVLDTSVKARLERMKVALTA